MAKGQITLLKDIRSKLYLSTGDRVSLICEEDRVIPMNSAVYAMKMMWQEMKGEAEKAGIQTDDDVMDLVKDFLESGITNPKIVTSADFLQME